MARGAGAGGAAAKTPAKGGGGEDIETQDDDQGADDQDQDEGAEGADEGADDGAQDGEDQDPDEDESESGEGTDSDDGAEGSEDDGDRGEDAEGGSEAEDGGEPATLKQAMEALNSARAEIRLMQEQMKNGGRGDQDKGDGPITDEKWAEIEQKWGGMPRGHIQPIMRQQILLEKRLNATLDARFARFEKREVIDEMSHDPKFRDIKAHMAGINEFMDNFDVSQHADPKLLALAYGYSKGKGSAGAVRKAAKGREINRRIAGPARPAGTGGGHAAPKKPGSIRLTPVQRQAAAAAGMSEKDYIANMRRRG